MANLEGHRAPRSKLGRVAILLTAVVGMGALSIDMFLPSLPALAEHYRTDSATAQLTVTLFLVGLAAAQLVFGPLSDRFGRRVVLIGGLSVYTVAGLACALAPGIRLLIAARVLQAFGAGSGPVVARAIVRDVYEREQAARALALMSTAQALTPILAPVLGGFLHVAFGWRSVFYVLAGFGAVFVLGALSLVRETNVRRDATALQPARLAENLRALLGSPAYLGYVAAVSLMFCGQFAFISGSSFVLIGGLGVAPDVYGFCFGSVAVGLMGGSFATSRITPRVGIDRMVLIGTALGACAGIAMAALAWGGARSVAAVIAPDVLLCHGPRARRAECGGGRGGTVSAHGGPRRRGARRRADDGLGGLRNRRRTAGRRHSRRRWRAPSPRRDSPRSSASTFARTRSGAAG